MRPTSWLLRSCPPLLAAALVLVLTGSGIAGCGEATSILIRVTSPTLDIPADVDTLEFSILGETTDIVVDRTFPVSTGWPHSISIRPGPTESSQVTVTIRARRGGALVEEEVITNNFVRGVDIIVDVVLGDGPPGDAGMPDAGDAGPRDAGGDAGGGDAGTDAGSDAGRDGGPRDAGPDAPMADAGCMQPSDCDDTIACTTDDCVLGACTHVPDDALCADGSTCSLTMGCPPRSCTAAAECDDRQFCNGVEDCDLGSMTCVPGTDPCDDANDCTDDTCNEAMDSCRHTTRDADGDGAGDDACPAAGGVPANDCDDARMEVFPGAPDVCDGQDNDCSGTCDSSSTCCRGATDPCMSSCGTMGARTCGVACSWSVCSPPAETCNGVDDDCNGACDDGFSCCVGATGMCTTTCGSTGTQTCGGDCTFGACAPPMETCNGRDDDCDGMCDDGFTCCVGSTTPCMTSCTTMGTRACQADCSPSATCTPPVETCNDIDEDCDTFIDEGFACRNGTTSPCTTTCGSTGTRTCAACVFGACVPPAEICTNAIDDDCDMMINEGCPVCGACPGATTVTAPGGRFTVNTGLSANTGSCGGTGAEGVLSFTLAAASDVFITTHQSAIDTILYVRSCNCAGSEVGCNDNGDGLLSSTLQLNDLAAGTYNVFVDTRSAASQAIAVDVYINTPGPASDRCGEPVFLLPGTVTVSGNTCGYTADYDNAIVAGPTNCELGGAGDSVDQVVYFYLPSSRAVTVSGCGATLFDSTFYARRVCTDGGLGSQVVCNDDGCATGAGACDPSWASSFSTTIGPGLFYLFIDGYGVGGACACGNFGLTISGI